MSKNGKGGAMSDLLRQAVRDAIEAGETTYLTLEQETGVIRASIMRFVKGTRSLRLDMADKLAAHFGLELKAKKKGR